MYGNTTLWSLVTVLIILIIICIIVCCAPVRHGKPQRSMTSIKRHVGADRLSQISGPYENA